MLRAYKIHEDVKSFPDTSGGSNRRVASCEAASAEREEDDAFWRQETERTSSPTLLLGYFDHLNAFLSDLFTTEALHDSLVSPMTRR